MVYKILSKTETSNENFNSKKVTLQCKVGTLGIIFSKCYEGWKIYDLYKNSEARRVLNFGDIIESVEYTDAQGQQQRLDLEDRNLREIFMSLNEVTLKVIDPNIVTLSVKLIECREVVMAPPIKRGKLMIDPLYPIIIYELHGSNDVYVDDIIAVDGKCVKNKSCEEVNAMLNEARTISVNKSLFNYLQHLQCPMKIEDLLQLFCNNNPTNKNNTVDTDFYNVLKMIEPHSGIGGYEKLKKVVKANGEAIFTNAKETISKREKEEAQFRERCGEPLHLNPYLNIIEADEVIAGFFMEESFTAEECE